MLVGPHSFVQKCCYCNGNVRYWIHTEGLPPQTKGTTMSNAETISHYTVDVKKNLVTTIERRRFDNRDDANWFAARQKARGLMASVFVIGSN